MTKIQNIDLDRLAVEDELFAKIRDHVVQLMEQRDKARQEHFATSCTLFDKEKEIMTLIAERDEARRDLCDLYVKGQPSSSNMTDKDYAAELGWDCFKEDGK